MPRRISREEAMRLGAKPRQMTRAEALAAGATPVAVEETPSTQTPASPAAFSPESVSGAALAGGGQGLTLGFADELRGLSGALQEAKGRGGLAGAAGAVATALHPILAVAAAPQDIAAAADDTTTALYAGRPLTEALRRRYVEERGGARAELAKARAAHPRVTGGAELAGTLAVPLPGPGKLKPAQSVLSRALAYAKAGAPVGASFAAGASEDDVISAEGLQSPVPLAEDVAAGGALGGVVSGVAGPAAELLGARVVRPLLRKMAERNAVRAILPAAGLTDKLARSGMVRAKKLGDEEIRDVGRRVLGTKKLRFLGGPAGLLDRTRKQLAAEGADVGAHLARADELVAAGTIPPPDPRLGTEAVDRALRQYASESGQRAVAAEKAYKSLAPGLERQALPMGTPQWAGQYAPTKAPTFRGNWMLKSDLQKSLVPQAVSKLEQDAYRAGLAGYTRNQYAQLEQALGPEAVESLRRTSGNYGTLAGMEKLLEKEVSRAAARKPIGMTEMQALTAGAGVGGVPAAGLAALVASLLRGRVASSTAVGADVLSRFPRRGPELLSPLVGREAGSQEALIRALLNHPTPQEPPQ